MKDIGEGTIRRIDWQELTPVVLLLRVFNTATGLRVLFLALLGILTTLLFGCWMTFAENTGRNVCKKTPQDKIVEIELSEENLSRQQSNYLDSLVGLKFQKPISFRQDPAEYLWRLADRSVLLPWNFYTGTGSRFFSLESPSWMQRGLSFLWFVIVLLIWSFFGGMICRTVALRLTNDQTESLGMLWCFMKKRGVGFVSAVMIVVFGILFCLVPIKLLGLCFGVPGLNYVVAVVFPFALLFGFFAMILLIGLCFGWPLLFAAVGTEGTDGFDSVSRLFSYVYQRPLHYLLYWTVSGILGFLGFVLLSFFIKGAILLTVHIGAFPSPCLFPLGDSPMSGPQTLVRTWCNLTDLFLMAYTFSWFWTSAVAIYLLLRRSVDATPFDEVCFLGAAAEKAQPIPEIKLDEKGAPVIDPLEKKEDDSPEQTSST